MEKRNHTIRTYICLICSLFIMIIGLAGCEKEGDTIGNDRKLQKFWKLSGYYDSEGRKINPPAFDPDTLFHYEVSILFLWNEYTRKYEIQGQGPFDIFWGEYSTSGDNSLKLNTLKTTKLKADFKELELYDSLYFHTLNDVVRYKIDKNHLMLFYGSHSEYMLFELKKEQHAEEQFYMTADINGMKWKGDPERVVGGVHYNYQFKKFEVGIGALETDEYLEDGLRYGLSIIINGIPLPRKGEFAFNNDGAAIGLDVGVMGICTGIDENRYINTRSTNGVVAITRLSRSFMEGYFYFDAKDSENEENKRTITNGKFFVPLNPSEIWFQKYEFVK